MKQLYFLLSLLLLATTAFAQQKFEFGFAVKAGIFTLPNKEQIGNTEENTQAGTSASFGTFAVQRLGGRFGISTELLYNYSIYKTLYHYSYSGPDFSSWSNTEKNFEVQSLILPLKVHFSLKKNGRMSLSAGVAPAWILSSVILTNYRDNSAYYYSTRAEDRVVRPDYSEVIRWFFTAGGFYRINNYTSLGLEFTGTLRGANDEFYQKSLSFCGVGYEETYPFRMKSLAISLHHNILR